MDGDDTGNGNVQYVSIDDARKMAREAAATTAERIISESNADATSSGQDPLGYDKGLTSEIQKVIGLANAVKQLSSSPLHDAIERKVGDLAANVVEGAFSPGQSNDDGGGGGIVHEFLNSNLAYGIGQGIGANSDAASIITALKGVVGSKRVGDIIDHAIDGGQEQQLSGQAANNGNNKESDLQMLLSLDPNNPEHVASYAESQGGISIDTARKMLMIHQDDIIKAGRIQDSQVGYTGQQQYSEGIVQEAVPEGPSQDESANQDVVMRKIVEYVESSNNAMIAIKDKMGDMEDTILKLNNEISDIKGSANTVVDSKIVSSNDIAKDDNNASMIPVDSNAIDKVPGNDTQEDNINNATVANAISKDDI